MNTNKLLLQIILGGFLAQGIIQVFFNGERKFEEQALGTETTSYWAKDNMGSSIHIIRIDSFEEPVFVNDYYARGGGNTVLFLGNSQTHSINQMKVGESNYIKIIHDSLANENTEVLCHSMPNAGLQEFYLSYMYWKDKLKIRTIVIPLFFDDLREDGIRDVFFSSLIAQRYLLQDTTNRIEQRINANLKSYWYSNAQIKDTQIIVNQDNIALKETVQEGVENKLNKFLEINSNSWNNRENVRGDFFVWLYHLRNTILRINANTIRKMIPKRYSDNMEALNLILNDCKENNVKVLLYIPPIRSDLPLPYQQDLYSKFKSDIKALCKNNQFSFADFDTIVPGQFWGYKVSTNLLENREVDYMHFQFNGHQILADSLLKHLQLMH
jgi:hypothetical protein